MEKFYSDFPATNPILKTKNGNRLEAVIGRTEWNETNKFGWFGKIKIILQINLNIIFSVILLTFPYP